MPPELAMRILPGAGRNIDGTPKVACGDEAHPRYRICILERRRAGFALSSLRQMELLRELHRSFGQLAVLLGCTAKPC
jgi:hypothetical protein